MKVGCFRLNRSVLDPRASTRSDQELGFKYADITGQHRRAAAWAWNTRFAAVASLDATRSISSACSRAVA